MKAYFWYVDGQMKYCPHREPRILSDDGATLVAHRLWGHREEDGVLVELFIYLPEGEKLDVHHVEAMTKAMRS